MRILEKKEGDKMPEFCILSPSLITSGRFKDIHFLLYPDFSKCFFYDCDCFQ
jgi:hypothetical protein